MQHFVYCQFICSAAEAVKFSAVLSPQSQLFWLRRQHSRKFYCFCCWANKTDSTQKCCIKPKAAAQTASLSTCVCVYVCVCEYLCVYIYATVGFPDFCLTLGPPSIWFMHISQRNLLRNQWQAKYAWTFTHTHVHPFTQILTHSLAYK